MRRFLLVVILLFQMGYVFSQKNTVDKIIAVIGEEIILKSDIENEFLHGQGQGLISSTSDYRAELLEQQLIQKLLIAQAKLDSITVSEDEVEAEVNNRIQYLVNNIGSMEKLEAYFKKPVDAIKSELRSPIREKLITERMQHTIVEKIRITPSEVRSFFRKLPKDSLPEVPDKYEIQQIVLKPNIGDAEKSRLRDKLREFRDQILNGEKTFNTLAVLYSDDKNSAIRGGELGYMSKTDLLPEFAEAAFNLKPGKISKIVETEYGFHIIQLIDRQGEKINVRHILLQPKVAESEREEAMHRLDTIKDYITSGKMTFEEAAFYFSTDKKTKNNGGLVSTQSADSKISKVEIEGELAKQVNKLKVNGMSDPFQEYSMDGREEFKIIKIKAFYPQHKANLDDDWTSFEMMLKNEKQMDKLEKWVKDKMDNTYIHIDDTYKDVKFRYAGWIK